MEISAQDFCKTQFCAQCGVSEVRNQGDICDTCKWVNGPHPKRLITVDPHVKPAKELISPMREIGNAKRSIAQVDRPKPRR